MRQISVDAGEHISAIELLRRHLAEHGFEGLEGLSPREKKALTLRFGLNDGIVRTREEVGRELNVTPERIRLIESKVIRWLHIPVRRVRMRDFLS